MWKLSRICLFCLLLLFTVCISCSFANSVDYSNFDLYNYNGDIMDFFKQAFEYVTSYNFDENWPINGATTQTYWIDLLNKLADDNCQFIQFGIIDNGDSYHVNGRALMVRIYKTPPANGEYLYYSQIYRKKSDNKVVISWQTPGNSNYTISGNLTGDIKQLYLINKNNSNIRANQLWYKSKSNNESLESSLKYFSNKTGLFTVNMPTGTYNMIKADYNLDGMINIGYLESYTTYDELQGYLAVYSGQSNQDNSYYWYTCGTYLYNKLNNTSYNNGVRLDYSTGQVYINSNLLQYNHAYSLYFTGNGTDTTEIKYYYFVPLGSSATSGDINNDNPYGLDFDFINSVEYISNLPSGNIEYIVKNELVPDSGDILGFIYTDYDNWGLGDFVQNTFNNLLNALFNYDNVSYDLGIFGVHSSSEFVTPSNNALITVVSLFVNCLLLLSSILWFFFTVCSVSVLDLDKIVKDKADLGLF